MNNCQLSIIIVNFNTFQLTSNCINSIIDKCKDLNYEIVLVDNASVECDPDLFKEKFPMINLVKSPTNTGFAGGNNLGIAIAKGTYILLLNSDTELINNAPKICLDRAVEDNSLGIITCRLTYPNGKTQYNCRRFRTIAWELLEVLPLFKLLPKRKQEKLMLHHYFDHKRDILCDWVWGTFMLFPKKVLEQLPSKKLNEMFFMYCEDVLWCWDFAQLGYKIQFVADAKVMHVHKGSVKTAKQMRSTLKMGIRNHLQFMKKLYSKPKWFIFAAIYLTKQYANMLLKYGFKV